jgi:hypothetical protein
MQKIKIIIGTNKWYSIKQDSHGNNMATTYLQHIIKIHDKIKPSPELTKYISKPKQWSKPKYVSSI